MVIEKIENYPVSLKSLGSAVTLLFLHLMPAMSANSTELSCPYPQHRSVLTWGISHSLCCSDSSTKSPLPP